MKKNKKIVVIVIIFIILLCISFFAIYLSMKEDKSNIENPPVKEEQEEVKNINKEIMVLQDERMLFTLENIVNNYYDEILGSNKEVYNVLEEKYKLENNINENNVLDKIGLDLNSATFVLENVYYNNDPTIIYYFINGYLYTQEHEEAEVIYNPNVNYLIIVKNNQYVIRPLESNIVLENIANSYNIQDVSINSSSRLSYSKLDETNKLSYYINQFINLLYLDNQKAYSMLTDETKLKYLNYEDFYNQRESIYNSFSARIFAFAVKEEENYKIYSIHDMNQKSIKVIEYKPKDFKIGY